MYAERILTRSMIGLLTAAVVGLGYNQMRARADGIPPTQTLTYAGTLEESNAPVNGTRNLRLTLWDDANSTEPARARCTTNATNFTLVNGRFQVPLDPMCTAVIRATPDLWMEVQVNGSSLGRSKLGAVPFAIEAARASELTPSAANALVPTGTVVPFAGRPDRIPTGWLLCDGRLLARSAYPALFDALGNAHGGDSMSFNLPDYRGRFLRGVAIGTDRDPDRASRTAAAPGGNSGDAVGSLQGGATAAPATPFTTSVAGAHSHLPRATAGAPNGGDFTAISDVSRSTLTNIPTQDSGNHSHTVGAGGDRETRPVNSAVHFIIKT